MQSNPSQIALDGELMAELDHQVCLGNKAGAGSDFENDAILKQNLETDQDLKSRAGSDLSLYRFLVKGTNKRQMLIFVTALSMMSIMERLPGDCPPPPDALHIG